MHMLVLVSSLVHTIALSPHGTRTLVPVPINFIVGAPLAELGLRSSESWYWGLYGMCNYNMSC